MSTNPTVRRKDIVVPIFGGLLMVLFAAALDSFVYASFLIGGGWLGWMPTLVTCLPTTLYYIILSLILATGALGFSALAKIQVNVPVRVRAGWLFFYAAAVAYPFSIVISLTHQRALGMEVGSEWWNRDTLLTRFPIGATVSLLAVTLLIVGAAGLAHAGRWNQSRGVAAGLRRAWVLLLCLLGPGAVIAGEALNPAVTPRVEQRDSNKALPNVLFITIDTLRRDHLSLYAKAYPYGDPGVVSPRIDTLAAESLYFTNAYSACSWTSPATASLLTGQFPSTHALTRRNHKLASSLVTLPEVFSEAGYDTAAFSGNLLISPVFGFDQGFDQMVVASDKNSSVRSTIETIVARLPIINEDGATQRPLMGWVEAIRTAFLPVEVIVPKMANLFYTNAGELTTHATKWLHEERDRPFFAYLHYMDPHYPYNPPEPYRSQIFNAAGIRDTGRTGTPTPLDKAPFCKPAGVLPDDELNTLLARYDGEIRYVDTMIGTIVDDLKARNLYDNTLIVLTADHGEEFYDHLNWSHGQSLYEEQLRVPLIIKPARYRSTERRPPIDATVRTVDLFPTVVELAGLITDTAVAGQSLVPLLEGTDGWSEVAPVAEVERDEWGSQSIVSAGYKLILSYRGEEQRTQLFDLTGAGGEALDHNLAPDNAYRDLLLEMARQLLEQIENAKRPGRLSSQATVDDQLDQRLKDLGYTH